MKGNYQIYISGHDWGCAVSKIFLKFEDVIDKINLSDLVIKETKQVVDVSKPDSFPLVNTTCERKIVNCYLCDKDNNLTSKASNYVCVELEVDPEVGNPLVFSLKTLLNTWSDPYYLTIELSKDAYLTSNGKKISKIDVDPNFTKKITDADQLKIASFEASDKVKYNYGYFVPKQESKTLVVWLHGLGEGGVVNTDPKISILAGKVTALFGQKFQSIMGNAHILVPQCPTYWMDVDGKSSNLNSGEIIASNYSYYTKSLTELIDHYQEKVKAEKVIIAGCSNGGYMTLILALNNPSKYQALVPICEALPDKLISDEQIMLLSKIPMFFIYSNDDDIVDPALHEIKTISRIEKCNPKDLCVSVTDHVIDTSKKYKDADGNPYLYPGHWSWIYFHNNESICPKNNLSVWEWMAEKVK